MLFQDLKVVKILIKLLQKIVRKKRTRRIYSTKPWNFNPGYKNTLLDWNSLKKFQQTRICVCIYIYGYRKTYLFCNKLNKIFHGHKYPLISPIIQKKGFKCYWFKNTRKSHQEADQLLKSDSISQRLQSNAI